MTQLNETAVIASNEVMNMYQYRSVRGGEQSLFVQMGDTKLYQQDTTKLKIPDLYPAASGACFTEAFDGSVNQVPASFSNVKDHMLYANGADQHQLYCGSGSLVDRFVVFDGAAAPLNVPDNGRDYSDQVRDIANTSSVAILDGLNTYAAFECIFIMTKVPVNSLTFNFNANVNTNASVSTLYYWNGTAWTDTSATDGTIQPAGDTMGQDGAFTWTSPGSAEQEKYMYGTNGFWYQIRVSAALSASVEVESVVFDDTAPQPLRNIWNGNEEYGVEVQTFVNADTAYYTYGAAAVDLGAIDGATDIIYLACGDKIEGIYIDVGATPTVTGTPTFTINYWTGTAWASVGTVEDGTNELTNSGWLTFPRKDAHPREFNASKYQAFWYQLVPDAGVDTDVVVSMSYMPYYDIAEFGSVGQSNCVWKDRACYSFDIYGPYIYVSSTARPMVLNGSDYGILKAGDGRYNKVVAQRKFVNELMVWQEEIGHEGGCITLFEGYSPSSFGKLVLSSKIGCMNAKSVAVVDGVMTSTETDERLKTIAFFLSRYGICATDGRTVSVISDDIGNYFDPQEAECINIDQKDNMWLNHDSADNVLRIKLLTGAAGTTAVYPVFDITDKTWSFDTPAQDLSCMAEVSSDSTATLSELNTVQLAGGDDDGFIYRLNNGVNDYNAAVSTLIDSYIDIEINADGEYFILDEMTVRVKTQAAGDVTLTFYKNGVAFGGTKTLDMQAAVANDKNRRHRFYLNCQDQHVTVRFQNATISQEFNIHDMGMGVKIWDGM
jgi:hypothetical protein